METTTKNIETSEFLGFTIEKNFTAFTVRITRKSTRARFGYKTVCYFSFKRFTKVEGQAVLSELASINAMNDFVSKFEKEQMDKLALVEEKKNAIKNARKNFVNPFTKGQILYDSWGYEQTNVNFYEVVELKGKTITVREIAQDRNHNHSFMSGTTMPVKGEFIGNEIKKVIQVRCYDGKISTSIKGMYTWDGKPKHYSSYH